MQNRLRTILGAMLVALSAHAVGQDQPDPVVIAGRITDVTLGALERVTVALRAVGVAEPIATVDTNRNGIFAFPPLPPKAYELHFEKPGFKPLTMDAAQAMALGVVVMQFGKVTEGPIVETRPPRRIIPPRAIKRVDPEYTTRAKAAGLQGTAIVRLIVDENGLPQSVTFVGLHWHREVIVDPLGLDEAAVAAIEKWRFKPSTRDDVPTPATVTIEMNFKLPATAPK